MHFQQLVHLLQFELVVGEQSERSIQPLDRTFTAFKVEARADLACHPSECIVDLGEVDSRDDVEARHGGPPEQIVMSRYSAPLAANTGLRLLRGRRAS